MFESVTDFAYSVTKPVYIIELFHKDGDWWEQLYGFTNKENADEFFAGCKKNCPDGKYRLIAVNAEILEETNE